MEFNWHPHFGPVRVGWLIWCAFWVVVWFIIGMLAFWPALLTLMPLSAIAGGAVFVEEKKWLNPPKPDPNVIQRLNPPKPDPNVIQK